jgi:hypothetical protein
MNKTFIEEQKWKARRDYQFAYDDKKTMGHNPDDLDMLPILDTLIKDTILATEAEIVKNGCVNYEIE